MGKFAAGDNQITNSSSENNVLKYISSIRWSYIGFGFYWAWTSIAFFSPVLGSLSLAINHDQKYWLIFALTALLVHILVLIFIKHLKSFVNNTTVFWLTPIISTVGIIFIALGSVLVPLQYGSGSVFCIIGAVMTGIGSSLTVLMWGELYSEISLKSSLLYTSAAFVLLAPLHFLVVSIPSEFGVVITAGLPILSSLSMLKAKRIRQTKNSTQEVRRKASLKPTILFPIIAIITLGSCCELLHALSVVPSTQTSTALMGNLYTLGGLIGTILMACIIQFNRVEGGIFSLARAIFVFMALGLLISTLLNFSFMIVYAIFGAAFWCFRIIVWASASHVAHDLRVSPLAVFSAVMCAFDFAIVLGIVYGASVSRAIFEASLDWTIVALITIVCIFLIAMLLFSEKQVKVLWGLAEQSFEVNEKAHYEEKLSNEFGLTRRETEVCLLLIQGRSLPYIREKLHIAEGTANTHVRHIYEKLNVHTRQELLDKIQALPAYDRE